MSRSASSPRALSGNAGRCPGGRDAASSRVLRRRPARSSAKTVPGSGRLPAALDVNGPARCAIGVARASSSLKHVTDRLSNRERGMKNRRGHRRSSRHHERCAYERASSRARPSSRRTSTVPRRLGTARVHAIGDVIAFNDANSRVRCRSSGQSDAAAQRRRGAHRQGVPRRARRTCVVAKEGIDA